MTLTEVRFKENHGQYFKNDIAWIDTQEAVILEKQGKLIITAENVYSLKELLYMHIPPIKYFVDRIIPEQCITYINGESGGSKSLLAQNMAMCIVAGIDFLGMISTNKGRVLYIDDENHLSEAKRRFQRFKHAFALLGDIVPDEAPLYIATEIHLKINIDTLKGQRQAIEVFKKLEKLIIKTKPDVVFLDSLSRFIIGDENSSETARPIRENLKTLCMKYNCAFVIIHHKGKYAPGGRGSSEFKAQADCEFDLNKIEKQQYAFTVFNSKPRMGRTAPYFSYEIVDVDNDKGLRLIPFSQPATTNDLLPTLKGWGIYASA
jgi:archaellum biogenesis ATPase FlaH